MQFIVFAAFAIVLSIPPDGPPWRSLVVTSPVWTAAIIAGQVVLAGLLGGVASRLVCRQLEHNPAWLPAAQQHLSRWTGFLRFFIIGSFAAGMYLTDWSNYVRSVDWMRRVWGLDELIMMSPFLLGVLVSWIALYPADRGIRHVSLELRLWTAQPNRPVWRLGSYLAFMFRHHVLIIFVPMLPIVVAIDAVSDDHYGRWLRESTGVVWADQAVLVVVAGGVFLIAPVLLRYIWHTTSLPAGELRSRLDGLCRRIGLSYRDILIWHSDGMVVNAAVMGLIRPVRYVLLSDGLLETMDDEQIEAVFGHEAGHIKHHHITFYLLFAILSMLIVGGISELVVRFAPDWVQQAGSAAPASGSQTEVRDYLQVMAMVMIVAIWGLGFGPVSRRFEWQADLFGARSVTPDIASCDRPCLVHGTLEPASLNPGDRLPSGLAICATAAHTFGEALHRIATLNGIPVEARSWRHSSIGNRIRLLRQYAADPSAIARLNRGVLAIKLVLVVGSAVGLAIGAWLYWPHQLIRALRASYGG
ncbi:MAG TPA: M48 family metallopeptidase [Phycisphaerae bacterium]|nr:M48 family metallopeptidase [Phycisphaerae bacterium]HOJ76164.1 M48 family metallopeptidase [Phycisphaerae bacterium]HOM53445.1 M48 family metallopeptidase [Phycisphaerae bacterium]HON66536.1 M48 family metallopeptidase [Phycisphaerae bacterium]HOQ84540.1 M48 family metallopeptidase [Phycisphaerae bacterium]